MTKNPLNLQFPVITFSGNATRVERTHEELTRCTSVALRQGYFNNMLVVDGTGRAVRVHGARKLHGVGPFWGYNIFLNQTIQVQLSAEGEPFTISLDEVKQHVFHSFKMRDGWSSRGDFDELQATVRDAGTIAEVIQLLEVK